MKAAETSLQVLLEGGKQYVVPLFQRTYNWDRKHWQTLWDDVFGLHQTGTQRDHFLGSIVTKSLPGVPEGIAPYVLIDGQQRLTTLTLLLAAIRDAARVADGQLSTKIDQLYLRNQFVDGLSVYKVLVSQADRHAYMSIIDGGRTEDGGRLTRAYRFFRRQLADALLHPSVSLEGLSRTVLRQLEIVSITLAEDDNEYRIFESLNAKGLPLQQVDLLRNYLFMRIPVDRQEPIYTAVWLPMEGALGPELEDFFRYDFMSTGEFVREGDVYQGWRKRLERHTSDEIIGSLAGFADRARYYERIIAPDTEEDARIAEGLRRLNRWGGRTMYPLLLWLYGERDADRLDVDGFVEILRMVESFLVRRLFVGVPTNALNRLFSRLPQQLPEGLPIPEAIRAALSHPGRRWPRDREFREGIARHPLYTDSRPDQRKLILEAFERHYGHKEAPGLAGLTIEHVMPQTLTEEWKAHLGEEWRDTHGELLHVLGNLTLTGYNPELSNRPWHEKRNWLRDSNLQLNRWITDQPVWRREQIEERGRLLADIAIQLWPGPDEELVDSLGDAIRPPNPDETEPAETPRASTGWTPDLLIRMRDESPPAMASILAFLAERPEREVTSEELRHALGGTRPQFRGVVGAFGHRLRSRYGMDTWPFEARWDPNRNMVVYRMPADVAEILRSLT